MVVYWFTEGSNIWQELIQQTNKNVLLHLELKIIKYFQNNKNKKFSLLGHKRELKNWRT